MDTVIDYNINLRYIIIRMKNKIYKSLLVAKKNIPYLMLLLMLSSIAIASFHNHDCNENSDNCVICSFRTSYSAATVESAIDIQLFRKTISEYAITYNDTVTDPSQKLVCSSHAPPQFS
jgi:hypothetical protein